MKKNKLIKIILIIMSSLIISVALYYERNYILDNFDTIFSTLFGENKGASPNVIFSGIMFGIPLFIIFFTLFYFLFIKNGKYLKSDLIKNKFMLKIFNILNKNSTKILIGIFIVSIITLLNIVNFGEFLKVNAQNTDIYKKEYVNPRNVNIKFPEKKKNLIHIYLESFETSTFSLENNGQFKDSIVPELEEIAKQGINFSNNNKLGGIRSVSGSTWTQAAIISQESAINYKPIYTLNDNFEYTLPNLYPMGALFKENGYSMKFLMGSESDFANRRDFLEYHGYDVYDLNSAKRDDLLSEDYFVWWGFEDNKLFEYAKKQLEEISKENKPFVFKMLTADTHFPDGYVDSSCQLNYDKKYLNAYACSSKKIGQFIKWLENQDFYKDTVIVITGDHLTMQKDVFEDKNRFIYNAFLNTGKDEIYTKNREATVLDIYPTILSAMDIEIEGERLGLGINLFSGEETLSEKYGYDILDEELYKNSKIYWSIIMGE